ncbi:hypothetical protein DID88_007370 [Monilinia fructigena]|uniref:CMP/dCMP-type deaminase domain-containing protein n=1 Tax=Monilinia fructigena TaxID=38457 RepID=A0A395J8J3_9HELO|nr:hypothetical protein DID88_007370 [Monilinia fructigena]
MSSQRNLPPDAKLMTQDEIDTHMFFMREALAMANLALNTNETPVGVFWGANENRGGKRKREGDENEDDHKNGDKIEANRCIYGPEDMRKLDLYVTIEPCIMCASLLQQFGIRKVWYGAVNDKFGGNGGVLNLHIGNGKFDGNEANKEEKEEKRDSEGIIEKQEGDYERPNPGIRKRDQAHDSSFPIYN